MFDYWFLCSRLGTSTDVHRTEALLESLRREWLVLSDCTLGGYQLVLLLLGDLLGNVASGAWFAEWHGRGSQDYLWLSVDLLSGGGPQNSATLTLCTRWLGKGLLLVSPLASTTRLVSSRLVFELLAVYSAVILWVYFFEHENIDLLPFIYDRCLVGMLASES